MSTWIVYAHLNRRGEEIATGKLRARRRELEAFIRSAVGRKKTHVTFEASRCSFWVFQVLEPMLGRTRIHVAQAHRIRAIANSRQKNDTNDSWWLAYLTQEGRLPEAYVPTCDVLELRIATRERQEAVRSRTRVINRLKSHLAQMGEVVPASSIWTDKANEYLLRIALDTPGIRGRALRSCLEDLEYWAAAVSEWDQAIAEIAEGLPDVETLVNEMPGIGPVLASTIIAEAGCLRRFTSAKSFAKYTGLTPSDRSSGGNTRHGSISREGSPYLRWALNQAVVACCRSRSGAGLAIGNWVRAKAKRTGVNAKARSAAARKLSESIWRLFSYGEGYDPARPFGQRAA